MRIYEELFILRPDTAEEETDKLIEQLSALINKHGGTVDKTDKWGIRKLAYRVQKRNEGFYVLLQFTAQPEAVKELERRMRVSDLVMKFITVRIDEKLKKIDKRKKSRERRAARRPAPQVAMPALSAEHMMAGGAEPGPRPGAPMPGAPMPAAPAAAPAASPATPVAPVEKE